MRSASERNGPRPSAPIGSASQDEVPVLDLSGAGGERGYSEGIHIGHRMWEPAGRHPAYPLGHGLGHPTWSYEQITLTGEQDRLVVNVAVRNRGDRRGREVVQVYPRRPNSAVERPSGGWRDSYQ